MAELSPHDRQLAIAELERIEQTLVQMSMWADGDSADRERCSIALEDASRAVQAAGWMLSRADRLRVAELVHRRMSPPGGQGPAAG
jgi:hypothetical protein